MMAVISLAMVLIALLYSVITYNRENKAREIADKRANEYKVDLESNKNELQEKNVELKELKDMEKFTSTGRIARTIAHEVRNPLTNILLATEQLREMENKNEEAPVLLELINRNADRINQLVSDLLNATRFTQLDFIKTDINQLLEETLEMAKDRIGLNHIRVEKDYSHDMCDIFVDKEKIKLALLNIIVNAIEAMENKKGLLQLKTRKQGSKCIVEIRDNGKGMDEEMLQKLYEPYFTSKPKGNGLGLTNTQNIILNHNGKISVYSKPGKGATFIITLDVHDSAAQKE
jgi:signal transduction histidine kinase